MKKHCGITINEQAKDILQTEALEMGERLGGKLPAYVSENELASTLITEIYTNRKYYRALLGTVEAVILARLDKKNLDKYFKRG